MLFQYITAWVGLTVAYLYNHFSTTGYVHVEIDKGILRGRNATTCRGAGYFSFKGIPYAKPPIDELRFKYGTRMVNTVVIMLFQYITAWVGLTVAYLYNHFSTTGYVHVEIDKGILRGRNATTCRGAGYFSFKAIPYAKPPIDELRFKGPQEETAWAGVRDAVFHGDICPQMDISFDIFRGREDCLFLNVYTPSLETELMPVMFWIHGGMFAFGHGNDEIYGPDYFMEAGVILVTSNYRIGALGFMSSEDDDVPGNAGLKDQVAALRWIRRNIGKFGGDPDNVTIFGGSAGAACAHLHLLSPMSKGLFSRAILQSGSAMNAWVLSGNEAENMVRLAKVMGAKNVAGDRTKALEFLKTAPYEDIVKVQSTMTTPEKRRLYLHFLFTPTVEKGVKSEEVFLPDSPIKILESGNYTKVPYIIGYTNQEGYFFLREMKCPEIMTAGFEDTERYVPNDIKNERVRNNSAKLIRKFYFDGKPIGMENISNFADLYSDATFISGINRAAKLQVKLTNARTYFFVFSHDDTLNILKFLINVDRPGALHGDELGYLFHNKIVFWKTPVTGSENEHVINTMTRLWTNFAKYGNPTPPGDPLDWKPVTTDKFHYLNISGEAVELAENPNHDRAIFWEKIYEKSSASHIP